MNTIRVCISVGRVHCVFEMRIFSALILSKPAIKISNMRKSLGKYIFSHINSIGSQKPFLKSVDKITRRNWSKIHHRLVRTYLNLELASFYFPLLGTVFGEICTAITVCKCSNKNPVLASFEKCELYLHLLFLFEQLELLWAAICIIY